VTEWPGAAWEARTSLVADSPGLFALATFGSAYLESIESRERLAAAVRAGDPAAVVAENMVCDAWAMVAAAAARVWAVQSGWCSVDALQHEVPSDVLLDTALAEARSLLEMLDAPDAPDTPEGLA
jgi:hypothetical protein